MCSLWKYMLLQQIAREIQFFLTYNVNEKNHKKSGQTNFDSVNSSYLYFAFVLQLCTHVTTLHSCYNFVLMLQLCIHVTWKCTPFQPIRNASFFISLETAVLCWWGMFPETLWCCVSSRYSKNTRFYQLIWWYKLATAESFHVLIISPSSEQRHNYKLNWLFCKFPISNMHLTRHLTQATLLLLLLNMCLLHMHVLCYFDTLGIWPLRLQKTAKNFDDALLLSFVGQSR